MGLPGFDHPAAERALFEARYLVNAGPARAAKRVLIEYQPGAAPGAEKGSAVRRAGPAAGGAGVAVAYLTPDSLVAHAALPIGRSG